MAAVTSAPCVTLFICILVFPLAAVSEVVTVNATTGHDCRMTCKISQKATVQLLELSKRDLKSEDFVFVFRRDDPYDISAHQLPSFKNRVNMEDTGMDSGEVSVTMKNVTKNDSGTYECYVVVSKTTGRQKRAPHKFSTTINLVVEDPGGGAGHTGDGGDKDGGNKDRGHVGLTAIVLVTIVVSALFISVWMSIRFKRAMKKSSSPPPPDKATVVQLL